MKFLKKLFAPVDMTLGKPWEDILVFTLPMLLGNIAQQLYNTVDSVVVGRYVGDNALAAVGSAGPIFNLLIVLFIGISVGAGILVSQYFGARNREELSRTIGNSLTLTACASLFVMAVDVDLYYYDDHHSCADRIWTCLPDKKSEASNGKTRKCVHFTSDFMDFRGDYDRYCLQERKMERKGNRLKMMLALRLRK